MDMLRRLLKDRERKQRKVIGQSELHLERPVPTIAKPIDPEAHLDIEKQKVTKTKAIDPRDTFELADEDFLK